MSNKLTLILRTCDNVAVFTPGNRPRDFGTKQEVMFTCIKSIKDSFNLFNRRYPNYLSEFIVIDDHSSTEMVRFVKDLRPDKFIPLETSGNGESFVACLAEATRHKGLLFFVEDDYLLDTNCIWEMVDIYERIKPHTAPAGTLCVHPSDYPDRYIHAEMSYVVLGAKRHWRSIKHTTCTFMIDDVILNKHYQNLYNFKNYGVDPRINEELTINMMYKEYLCFSPIPSLAEHYQFKETLSPFTAMRGIS